MTTQIKTLHISLIASSSLIAALSSACVFLEPATDEDSGSETSSGDGDGDGDTGDGDGDTGDGDGDTGDGDGDTGDGDGDGDPGTPICPGAEEFCTEAESHCDLDGLLQICQYVQDTDCIDHFVVDCETEVGAGSMCVTVSPTEGGCTQASACGDGALADGEECDDGNMNDLDGCSSSCVLEARLVFITSTLHDGNLGGVAGADQICNDLAGDAGLPGTYMAWLSSSQPGEEPVQRFVHSTVPYVLVDGSVVSPDWDTFTTDGTLLSLILLTETGGPAPMGNACSWSMNTEVPVLTGTFYDGTLEEAQFTCDDYTATSGDGRWGYADDPTFGHWSGGCSDASPDACANTAALYCFQQ